MDAPKSRYPIYRFKDGPDEIDRRIFDMIAQGMTTKEISEQLGMTVQSVDRRVQWVQAKRWATFSRRLVNAEQRQRLLDLEVNAFKEGS